MSLFNCCPAHVTTSHHTCRSFGADEHCSAPAAFGYGLGLAQRPVSCGESTVTTWGHDGIAARYATDVLHTEDGRRQVAYSLTMGPTPDPEATRAAVQALQTAALCGG